MNSAQNTLFEIPGTDANNIWAFCSNVKSWHHWHNCLAKVLNWFLLFGNIFLSSLIIFRHVSKLKSTDTQLR